MSAISKVDQGLVFQQNEQVQEPQGTIENLWAQIALYQEQEEDFTQEIATLDGRVSELQEELQNKQIELEDLQEQKPLQELDLNKQILVLKNQNQELKEKLRLEKDRLGPDILAKIKKLREGYNHQKISRFVEKKIFNPLMYVISWGRESYPYEELLQKRFREMVEGFTGKSLEEFFKLPEDRQNLILEFLQITKP